MFKFYFLAVTYGIAFLIIGVCFRKPFVFLAISFIYF